MAAAVTIPIDHAGVVRAPLEGRAPARDDRRAVCRRSRTSRPPTGTRSRSSRRRARRSPRARSGQDPRAVCRSPCAPGAETHTRPPGPRDHDRARAERGGHGDRREAHDLPPDRRRGAEVLRAELGLRRIDARRLRYRARPTRRSRPTRSCAGFRSSTRTAGKLSHTYGSLASDVLSLGALEPLVGASPERRRAGRLCPRREWALTVEDVLRRRTTLRLTGLGSDPRRSTLLARVRPCCAP